MTKVLRLATILFLAAGMGGLRSGQVAHAAQALPIANCTFQTLQDDLQAGGLYFYPAGLCTSIVFTGTITISSATETDLSAQDVTLDGNGKQMFNVTSSYPGFFLDGLKVQNGYIVNSGYTHISTSTFSGISFPNGAGAIWNKGGTLNISQSTFSDNTGYDAGAIYNESGGTASITDSTFLRNSGTQAGAIRNALKSTLTITGGTFSNNTGDAINNDGTGSITGSTLSDNTDSNGGGAIDNGGTLTINSSTLSGNTANGPTGFGGAIATGGTLTINDSTLSGNTAIATVGGEGGAIYNGGALTINRSTLSGNTANGQYNYGQLYGDGGAIFNEYESAVSIYNSTITGNTGTGPHPEAILNYQISMSIGGTIVANNTGNCINIYSTSTDKGYNLTDGKGTYYDCGLTGTTDLVNTDPMFITDGAGKPILAGNGGPTQTMALKAGSPAIDKIPAGTLNCAANSKDQRGYARPDAGDTDGSCDIGAYEYAEPSLASTSLSVNPASGLYGGRTDLTATLISGGTGVAGETITFSLNGTAVCGGSGQSPCPSTDANGKALLTGVSLSGLSAGTYPSSGSCGNTVGGGIYASFGGDSANAASSGCTTLTVSQASQATLTVTGPPSGTYGQTLTLSSSGGSGTGAVTYDVGSSTACSVSGTRLTITSGTGSCTVTATKAADTNYTSITSTPANVTVSKATLTITPTHDAVSYGDLAPTSGWGYTSSGFVPGDSVTTITGTPRGCGTTYMQGNPPGSSYSITCTDTSGMSATNYTFTLASGTLTVGTRAIEVTASDAGYTYGGTPPASYGASVTAGSLAGTDSLSSLGVTCSPVVSTTQTTAAGTYSITCSGGDQTDYSYTYKPGTLTVSPRPVIVTASSPPNQTYGTAVAPSITCTSSDFLNADTFTSNPVGSVYSSDGKTQVTIGTTSNAGSYTTECNGGSVGSNYTIADRIPGSFTITRAPLTFTVNASMTYGGTAPTLNGITATSSANNPAIVWNGFVRGDGTGAVSGSTSGCTSGASGTASVATYSITGCTGFSADNYNISFDSAHSSVIVNPAMLTVSCDKQSRAYGGANPTLAYSIKGFANNDPPSVVSGTTTCSTSATASSNVGAYAITLGSLSGLSAANYTFQAGNNGTLTITPVVLTVRAPNVSVQYSDSVPSLAPTITGYVPGQGASALTTAPSCTSTVPTAPFTNVAGATTTTSGVAGPAGAYTISCSGGSATNYIFDYMSGTHYTPGTLTVTPEDATVQVNAAPSAQVLGTGPITLTATVRDSAASGYAGTNGENSSNGSVGDVTKTFVEFDIYNAATCLSGTPAMNPVVQVSTSATSPRGVGTATYSLPSPASDASYCVLPRIVGSTAGSTNSYYTATTGSVNGIAFYTNTGQFATGGGWIADTSSGTGQGSLMFNARYTKTGGAKGQMAYSWLGMYNGQRANFTITSNAISTLTFSGTTSPITATLQGKAAESIVSVATGQVLSSLGNLTFTATAKDGDYGQSQNVPSDAFSLSVFNGGTPVRQITATPLGGGNLVVHNG